MYFVDGCHEHWYKVFEHDAQGNKLAGDKEELIRAVRQGATVRVQQGNYFTSVQNMFIIEDNVCAQALFHVSKAGYDKFQVCSFFM